MGSANVLVQYAPRRCGHCMGRPTMSASPPRLSSWGLGSAPRLVPDQSRWRALQVAQSHLRAVGERLSGGDGPSSEPFGVRGRFSSGVAQEALRPMGSATYARSQILSGRHLSYPRLWDSRQPSRGAMDSFERRVGGRSPCPSIVVSLLGSVRDRLRGFCRCWCIRSVCTYLRATPIRVPRPFNRRHCPPGRQTLRSQRHDTS